MLNSFYSFFIKKNNNNALIQYTNNNFIQNHTYNGNLFDYQILITVLLNSSTIGSHVSLKVSSSTVVG